MNELRSLAIIGAGGHSKVVAEAAILSGWDSVSFFDDKKSGETQITGNLEKFFHLKNKYSGAHVAIGDNHVRKKLYEALSADGVPIKSIIHPTAIVSKNVLIADGFMISAGAIISSGVNIGKGVIVNTGSIIEHDCVIEDFCHISPGCSIGGNARVRMLSWLGIGSTAIHNVEIGQNTVIGAGSVVVNDIPSNCKAIGSPCKVITRNGEG